VKLTTHINPVRRIKVIYVICLDQTATHSRPESSLQ
jgi:hypothetical protein